MKTIAVFNIKGGVGKTATAVNLSYLIAAHGHKVLLADMDAQGAASYYLNVEGDIPGNANRVFIGQKELDKAIVDSPYEKLYVLPADKEYRNIDVLISNMRNGKKWLRNFFKPVQKEFEFAVIDCPPGISNHTDAILREADVVLCPVIPTTLSLRTYQQMKDYFKSNGIDQKKLIPFFSMYERRKNLHNEILAEFLAQYPESIMVAIPFNSEIEKMGVFRKPFIDYHPGNEISYLYDEIWKSIKKKLK